MVPFSVLDLANIRQGGDATETLRHSVELAQHVEKLGFHRFWLAEHHNMPGIASAATAVVIGQVAAGTKTIRVGSGGIMLPNHAPLVIAEQFGTLAALFPGRIDLGLGRAPGTDPLTARALRRGTRNSADEFPQDVLELQNYFRKSAPGQPVRAIPGEGQNVPIYILGSSTFGAQVAAALGVPFAFASHFAPDSLYEALAIYRREFRPSASLEKPHAMAAIGVFAADSDEEARYLFTSIQQSFVLLRRGTPSPLPAPVKSMDGIWSDIEAQNVGHAFGEAVVGSPQTVKRGLSAFLKKTLVDELIVTAAIHDHDARLRSFELVAQVRNSLA